MRTKALRQFEILEARYALNGSALDSQFLASNVIASQFSGSSTAPAATAPAASGGADLQSGPTTSVRLFLASTPSGPTVTAANQWDWLANTVWYVPAANLLAYSMLPDLTHAQAVGDQTLWHITSSSDGQIAGYAAAQLSTESSPSTMTFTGIVTDDGQIQIDFAGNSTTTGVGQMRLVDGAWTMEMQMATGSSVLVTHWAYMVQQTPGIAAPGPGTSPPSGNYLSTQWSWFPGTHWTITDSTLFSGQSASGVFDIDGYSNGYFWGTGTGTGSTPFNVFGSVTPEGNLLLLISVDGAPAMGRMGVVQQTSTGATMTFRSYNATPSAGSAWTLSTPGAAGLRDFLASS